MNKIVKASVPDMWLLILIIALPQLTETIYTPSLPSIADFLKTTHAAVEQTLTIFLFGFAFGTLIWGKLSDKYGRKPSLLSGFLIYALGCIGCALSTNISYLMFFRFVQAFGGSAGSVLGQVICRDVFSGAARNRAFSVIGLGIALAPALGPIIGGTIAQIFCWQAIFLFLIMFSILSIFLIAYNLPETYKPEKFSFDTIKNTFFRMLSDKRVLMFGLLVAFCNGISFSYFAEAPFYLITLLNLTPSFYGSTFILLASSTMIGNYTSKKLNEAHYPYFKIICLGAGLIFFGALIYTLGMFLCFENNFVIALIISSMSIIMSGIGMMIPNLLSAALKDYQGVMGTASSFFGFYYYILISIFTFIMSVIHNHTLWPMPVYFMLIAMAIGIVVLFLKKYEK